jgi:glycosyltransferase involved in cell wall biosynthesis
MLSAVRGLALNGHQVTLVCQPNSRLHQRATAQGIVPLTLRLRGDFDPHIIAALHRVIRRRHIQLVCGNMDKEIRQAGIAAKLAGVPLVRRRGTDRPFPNTLRHRLVNEHLVTRVIVNARAIEKTLLDGNAWLPPEKIKLIYNGFSPPSDELPAAREHILRELGLAESYPLLVHVGLLKARKGHDILLRAVQDLANQFPRFSLLVVGEGEFRADLEALARRLQIGTAVRFLGYRTDVSRFIGAADILILPTRNEGFPWVLAEAMSLAKPVVASRVGGIPELVEDGRTGFLVPPDDPAALKTAIIDLAQNPDVARRFGLAGQNRIRECFSLERMIDELEEFFAEVVGREGLRPDP